MSKELRAFIFGQEKNLATLSGEGGGRKNDRRWPCTQPALGPILPMDRMRFVPGVDLIEMMRSRMGNLRLLRLFDGSGHWVQHERSAEVNTALLQFLTGL